VTAGRTHYDTLGVRSDAGDEEIRAAYRRIARDHHPDVASGADPARLAAASEAWHVLGNRDRRAAYDRRLRAQWQPRPPMPHHPAPAAPVGLRFDPLARYRNPPRFPWRLMASMTAIGVAMLALGVAFRRDPQQRPVDNLLGPGSCVTIAADGDVVEAHCDAPNDGVVVRLVAFGESCPPPERGHRDRQGLGIACLAP
jgi:molecular chaperone DnaJ